MNNNSDKPISRGSRAIDLQERFPSAIAHFWSARRQQMKEHQEAGRIDAESRDVVTCGTQMGALEVLVSDILMTAGLDELHIHMRTALELPGYYRPEKKWDLLAVAGESLVCALEFKSQVGPSFDNNVNNHAEEALGSATDLWTAYREGLLGYGPRPLLGYFFLLEDCPAVHHPVQNSQPYFKVDADFAGASHAVRYELLCRRLIRERLYDTACLTLSTSDEPYAIHHPADDLSIRFFAAELHAAAVRIINSR